MSARLDKALMQLPPDKIRRVEDFAEMLIQEESRPPSAQFLAVDWAGKAAASYPDASGVEAAHAAGRMMGESLATGRGQK